MTGFGVRPHSTASRCFAWRTRPFRTSLPNRHKNDYAKKDLPLFGVRFDGVLQVTDVGALVEAVRGGIGPAKAFGFGLLSLAPV